MNVAVKVSADAPVSVSAPREQPYLWTTVLSLGVIAYTIVKVGTGRYREVSIVLWILTVLFILRYVYLAST